MISFFSDPSKDTLHQPVHTRSRSTDDVLSKPSKVIYVVFIFFMELSSFSWSQSAIFSIFGQGEVLPSMYAIDIENRDTECREIQQIEKGRSSQLIGT